MALIRGQRLLIVFVLDEALIGVNMVCIYLQVNMDQKML